MILNHLHLQRGETFGFGPYVHKFCPNNMYFAKFKLLLYTVICQVFDSKQYIESAKCYQLHWLKVTLIIQFIGLIIANLKAVGGKKLIELSHLRGCELYIEDKTCAVLS